MASTILLSIRGPSPRGRGNPGNAIAKMTPAGTIPAWAGEPWKKCARAACYGDHPRVGGGTEPGKFAV